MPYLYQYQAKSPGKDSKPKVKDPPTDSATRWLAPVPAERNAPVPRRNQYRASLD